MYVVNPEAVDVTKLYKCNGIVAQFLIYKQHLPLFGKDKTERFWYFAKTDKLKQALTNVPFYMKLFI